MSDRRRHIAVLLKTGDSSRVVTVRADRVREDEGAKVRALRGKKVVAEFNFAAVVGWWLADADGGF